MRRNTASVLWGAISSLVLSTFAAAPAGKEAVRSSVPERPNVIGNHLLYWGKLSDEEKGRAKTEFTGGYKAKAKKDK